MRRPIDQRLTVCIACGLALHEHAPDELVNCHKAIGIYRATRQAIKWETCPPLPPGTTLPDPPDKED